MNNNDDKSIIPDDEISIIPNDEESIIPNDEESIIPNQIPYAYGSNTKISVKANHSKNAIYSTSNMNVISGLYNQATATRLIDHGIDSNTRSIKNIIVKGSSGFNSNSTEVQAGRGCGVIIMTKYMDDNKELQLSALLIQHLEGKGSFGFVILVYHQNTGQEFAVKCFHGESLNFGVIEESVYNTIKNAQSDQQYPSVFLRYYGSGATTLKHNFTELVTVDDSSILFFPENLDAQLITLEPALCNLEDLLKWRMEHKKPFTEEEVFCILQAMAKALHFLWQEGVVHRDISPKNIMISSDKESCCKIADFSCSQILRKKYTKTKLNPTQRYGTPGYMAPEVLAPEVSNKQCQWYEPAKADIYSSGKVIMKLLPPEKTIKAGSLMSKINDLLLEMTKDSFKERIGIEELLATLGQLNERYHPSAKNLELNKDAETAREANFIRLADKGDILATTRLAWMCHEKQEYERALNLYKKASLQGSADALHMIGLMRIRGLGTNVDVEKGIKDLEKSAKKGYCLAQICLGSGYFYGQGLPKDHKKAKEWLKIAASQENPIAYYLLGQIHKTGCNYQKALNNFTLAAKKNLPAAQGQLGIMYLDGLGTNKDLITAKTWLQRAADQNDSEACYRLGELLWKENSQANLVTALNLFQKAAAKGNADAAYHASIILRDQVQDHKMGHNCLLKAASLGHATAQFEIGVAYLNGDGKTKNLAEAYKWFRKAADISPDAQYYLGIINIGELGIMKDDQEALFWLKKAAENHHPRAQCKLGFIYRSNDLHLESLKWFEKAAMQNDLEGQFECAWAFDLGLGVAQDYAIALKWYSKAAAKGHIKAQTELGIMFLQGLGVGKDYSKARILLKKASDGNYARAEYYYGLTYKEGHGVMQDCSEAIKLFKKSADKGCYEAQQELSKIYLNGLCIAKNLALAVECHHFIFRSLNQMMDPNESNHGILTSN